MNKIIPDKLKIGDTIGIIAPARSHSILSNNLIQKSILELEKIGLNIIFLKNIEEEDILSSSSIESRVNDLHAAFQDKNIKAILTSIGGYNTIELLPYINFDIIKKNPKIFCGYSDITTLSLSIFKKTGLITYSGPHFSSFSIPEQLEYLIYYFQKSCFDNAIFEINHESYWYDDEWFLENCVINKIENQPPIVYSSGDTEGTLIGGHLRSLNSLQGTSFMPSLKDSIVFIEEDFEISPQLFLRNLFSLTLQDDFQSIKGLLIGRFQKKSNISSDILNFILEKTIHLNIPIIGNISFGHTMPIVTLPIGGKVKIYSNKNTQKYSISILEH